MAYTLNTTKPSYLISGVLIFGIIASPIFITSISDRIFAQAPIIDKINCDKTDHFNFHSHANLDVIIDGMSFIIPRGIDIRPSEYIYWLHTHDMSGIIHIESPENRIFTLGQFFHV